MSRRPSSAARQATKDSEAPAKPPATKGERTAQRILQEAEILFAEQGYNNTSLRDVAKRVGIQVPGLYKYFPSKEALYEKVLEDSLSPIEEALKVAMNTSDQSQLATLPSTMTDIFREQPRTARLFLQALLSEEEGVGKQMVRKWLSRFLKKGAQIVHEIRPDMQQTDVQVMTIDLFNLTVGYFVSQGILDLLGKGSIMDDAYIDSHKRLLNDWISLQIS